MYKYQLLLVAGLLKWGSSVAQINDLPRTSPEAVGLHSCQVSAFFDSLLAYPKTDIHSVIVMRRGKVVGELYPVPFRAAYHHTQFSCSKTFVAAAVGIAIGEGRLKLSDRLVNLLPDYLPRIVSWRLSGITVEDLLTMRSGFVVDTRMRTISDNWIRDYLAHPMNADPGKRFQYDSINTYLLAAIVRKVTGMNVLAYLKIRLFRGMKINDVKWEVSPEGITTGGWGLYIQPESLAKFGQLLLQRGWWNGQQLIPASWVDAMMTTHVSLPNGGGYGYQMWSCNYPSAYRADGAYGQYIIVVPREEVVVVINQCTLNSGSKEQQYVWNTLFRGMSSAPLSPSPDYQQLLARCDSLPVAVGANTSPVTLNYLGRTIRLGRNPLGWKSLSLESDTILQITDTAGVSGHVLMGCQRWLTSSVPFRPLNARYAVRNQFSNIIPPFRVGACYAWQGEELYARLHFVDWMGSVNLRFRFQGDTVRIVAKENYQSKPVSIIGLLDALPQTEEQKGSGVRE